MSRIGVHSTNSNWHICTLLKLNTNAFDVYATCRHIKSVVYHSYLFSFNMFRWWTHTHTLTHETKKLARNIEHGHGNRNLLCFCVRSPFYLSYLFVWLQSDDNAIENPIWNVHVLCVYGVCVCVGCLVARSICDFLGNSSICMSYVSSHIYLLHK